MIKSTGMSWKVAASMLVLIALNQVCKFRALNELSLLILIICFSGLPLFESVLCFNINPYKNKFEPNK